jgi:hypothetical protein
MAKDSNDKMSSIVMKAIDATTFSELQAFTKDLEGRPIDRLLRDVIDLVKVSDSKAQLVSYVVATKYRHGDANVRKTILASLEATVRGMAEGELRDRVSFIVDRIRIQES